MEAVCSPCASHETGSVASDGEGVDYHQDELVSKFTSSIRLFVVLYVMYFWLSRLLRLTLLECQQMLMLT